MTWIDIPFTKSASQTKPIAFLVLSRDISYEVDYTLDSRDEANNDLNQVFCSPNPGFMKHQSIGRPVGSRLGRRSILYTTQMGG